MVRMRPRRPPTAPAHRPTPRCCWQALAEQRQAFAPLIAQGVSNSEACGIVGINRRTGHAGDPGVTSWPVVAEPLHYPPAINTKATQISARYLSEEERVTIANLPDGTSSRAENVHHVRRCTAASREGCQFPVDDKDKGKEISLLATFNV